MRRHGGGSSIVRHAEQLACDDQQAVDGINDPLTTRLRKVAPASGPIYKGLRLSADDSGGLFRRPNNHVSLLGGALSRARPIREMGP